MSTTSPPGANLVVAPSQPRAGLLLIRVLGDVDPHGAQRCVRVVRGAVDAAAAERDGRGASAAVVCDVTEVGTLGRPGRRMLADVERYARFRGVAFDVVGASNGASDGASDGVSVAG